MDYKAHLERLIGIVVAEGASDLHLTVGREPSIRISRELVPLLKEPALTAEDTAGLASTLMSDERQKLFLQSKDVDFAYSSASGERFRGNAFVQKGLTGIALRYIPKKIKTFDELNLPAVLKDFAFRKQGFFLVVGPVGQGKSTTLVAMVELINQERIEHIITIEDPVEFIFTPAKSIIDQREVRFDTKDFATGLKYMLRQDANVALVGEMRDLETISTAVTAAETGHLILSTLHTNSASQTIDRIIDSFPPGQQNQIRLQLASSLAGIFSQRLVPRISGGLIPAYELLINNYAVSNLIREGRTGEINVLIETGSELGMIDLNHSLAELVRRGEIHSADAIRYSLNPRGLERLL